MYRVSIAFIFEHAEPFTPVIAPLIKKLELVQENISHVTIPLHSINADTYAFSLKDAFKSLAKQFKKKVDISNAFEDIAGRLSDDQTIELAAGQCKEIVSVDDCLT